MSARSWLADRLDTVADRLDDWAARLEMAAARVDESYPSVTCGRSEAFYAPPGPTDDTPPPRAGDGLLGASGATHDPTSGTAEGENEA